MARLTALSLCLLIGACTATRVPEPKPAQAPQRSVHDPGEPAPEVLETMHCPSAIIQRARSVDLRSSENSAFFSSIASEASAECHVEVLVLIAKRIDASSDPQVVGDFCSTAATYSRFLSSEAREQIKGAYLRVPYRDFLSTSYFIGLRHTGIDIREHLQGTIAHDWSFSAPGNKAQTWDYYLYLASLDEPGAYEALANKIASTKDGNDATNLLSSLADLKTEGARTILRLYAKDTRRADGPDGPGMQIAERVRSLLEQP